jgi:hypothetical protein
LTWRWVAAVAVLWAGCGGHARRQEPEKGVVVFTGACDASGAVWLRGSLVAVADDEDNALRIYDTGAPGPPIEVVETRAALAEGGKHPEMDLEAAARIGDRVYWLASHGRKKSGKPAPSRLRLFATDIAGGKLVLVGTVYTQLVDDLVAVAGLELGAAAARSPSDEGGLNIEGLDATGSGQLLLGFRSPLRGGRALVIPIENPAAVVERGERAVFGAPTMLDLGGRGVRAMEWDGRWHWIVAGGTGAPIVEARLYRWDGRGEPRLIRDARFPRLNPEALARVGGRMLLLSDDGERRLGGSPCKKLKDSAARHFRGTWLDLRGALVSP